MKIKPFTLMVMLAVTAVFTADAVSAPTPVRSPRNQVYQFMAKGPGSIAGYLWIPEEVNKLRGLLIFAQNVPEGLIAGHPLIRKTCAENQLGILYTASGFWPGKMEDFGNPNATGATQSIDFKKIGAVPAGTASVPLEARVSSGLPVKYYVEAGPAIVENDRLVFTKIPPGTKYPIEVTVVAWQWGTCEPPLFQRAVSSQTFQITK